MADDGNPVAAAPPAKSGRKAQIIVIALLMVGEGAAVYFVANALSPAPVASLGMEADGMSGEGVDQNAFAEVELAECRPNNRMTGKMITFQIRISALVPIARLEEATNLIEAKKSRIRDRVNFVVRSAEPKHLNEPGLETVKRRLKAEFDGLFEDPELFRDILIPEFIQSNSGV